MKEWREGVREREQEQEQEQEGEQEEERKGEGVREREWVGVGVCDREKGRWYVRERASKRIEAGLEK